MKKCAICGKRVARGAGPFFRVPKEEWRRELWSKKCKTPFKEFSVVCSDHFLPKDLIQGAKRTTLMPNAMPFSTTPQLTVPTESNTYNANDNIMNKDSGRIIIIPVRSVYASSNPVMEKKECHTQTDSPLQESLQIEIYKLKEKIKQLEQQNADLSSDLGQTKAISTSACSIFTNGQIRKLAMPDKSIKWEWNDVTNAICLHASGPNAYNYLYQKGFPLPHISTLHHWYRKVKINEGIVSAAVDLMRQLTLSKDEKICVLAFDEMQVRETYENGQTSSLNRKSANYVQVVMVRGLKKSWKQLIFFDFDCKMTDDILNSIISTLYDAGFPVVAVICDSGSTNQKLWQSLDVTIDRPWFPHPSNAEEKVFTFVDTPHLLKLIRNYFLETGLMWKGNVLTAQTIVDLMKHIEKSDNSIAFKLTDKHLSVRGKEWQKVKLGAQLFSNTTANALRHCHSLGMKLYKPLELADMLQLVNDWFDILNSSVAKHYSSGKEPFGVKLRDQEHVIRRMNEFMSMPIVSRKTNLEQFQRGILMTNAALVMLHKYVKTRYNLEHLVTDRLNQHVLEHFFGVFRKKGGSNDQPTPNEFKEQLRKYILMQNRENISGTANNEKDTTEWLDESVFNTSDIANEPFDADNLFGLNVDAIDGISILNENILEYMS